MEPAFEHPCTPTESRVGASETDPDGPHARWSGQQFQPACGEAWLRRFKSFPARLSIGFKTHREWCAFLFESVLVKGFCRPEPIAAALAPEGVFPVLSECDGERFAMATIWFNCIRDSVCGSYVEIVLSFDVSRTRADAVAFRCNSKRAAWAIQYPSFGKSVCDAQFLHSLWIDSPLSIAWGREMQGFPKHSRPVDAGYESVREIIRLHIRWDENSIFRIDARCRFRLFAQTRGLLATQSLGGILRFLASSSFQVPIIMPVKTAAQNGVGRQYLGHIWKGRRPAAVQVWPWAPDDVLEIGDAEAPTGCEEHNGNRLLKAAGFRPVAVTMIPAASAFVESVNL